MEREWTLPRRLGEGFLTAEQERRYGRYVVDPDQAQLDRYFYLDTAARGLVDIGRGEHNRLGFAVQLGAVRFLGTFLPDPTDVPWVVASYVAAQLGIVDPGVLKQYASREGTNRLHAGEIQQTYGYWDFGEVEVQQDLAGWLHARTRLASERPSVLFDLATARLLDSKVLLPGPMVLGRLVASVRDQAASRLWNDLAAVPDAGQRGRLVGPVGGRRWAAYLDAGTAATWTDQCHSRRVTRSAAPTRGDPCSRCRRPRPELCFSRSAGGDRPVRHHGEGAGHHSDERAAPQRNTVRHRPPPRNRGR